MQKLDQFNDVVAETALKLYPENVKTPEFQLTSMTTDVRLTCASNYLANILAAAFASPVYRYIATYYTKEQSAKPFGVNHPVNYAYHGIDVFGFFNTMHYVLAQSPGMSDIVWQQNVQSEVMAFVNTGKPAVSGWLAYPEAIAELDTTTMVHRSYHAAQCEFWLKNGFFSYAWIN